MLCLIFVSACSVSEYSMQEKKSDCIHETCSVNVADQKTLHRPSFAKDECVHISGKYKDLGKRQSLVVPDGQYVLGGERSLSGIFEGYAKNTDDLIFQVEKIREIPFRWIEKTTTHRVGPKMINDISRQKDESEFYKQAQVLLKQDRESLNLILMDKYEVAYKKITLSPKKMWADCQKNLFVIKLNKIFGGTEGSSGSMSEIELSFTTIDDSSLKLSIHNRILKNSRLFRSSDSHNVESQVFTFQLIE